MRAELRHWDVAQQPWRETMKEQEDNVVYVDFKKIREAEEGA
ncbi:hypothetical protein [Bradyrhizobium sp. Ai1a-2]|nr:hypothetical protein [Bradyrhizobium sp. Ai1a-2]